MTEAEVVGAFATLGQAHFGRTARLASRSCLHKSSRCISSSDARPFHCACWRSFSFPRHLRCFYLAGAMAYGDGVAAALEELRGKHTLSTLGIVAASLINHPISHANRKQVHADWSLGGSRNFREARGTKGSIGLWMWCWWCVGDSAAGERRGEGEPVLVRRSAPSRPHSFSRGRGR